MEPLGDRRNGATPSFLTLGFFDNRDTFPIFLRRRSHGQSEVRDVPVPSNPFPHAAWGFDLCGTGLGRVNQLIKQDKAAGEGFV